MKIKWVYALLCTSLLLSLAVTPVYAVSAIDGDGAMTVSPASVAYDSSTTFSFTFTADSGDFASGTQVVITIPTGWTPPSNSGAGRVLVASHNCSLRSPGVEIAGFDATTVSIDLGCAQGETFTVTYANAKPSGVLGSPFTFTTTTEVPGGTAPAMIALSPTVEVTPKIITASSAGLTPGNKVYDGDTTVPTIVIGTPALIGVVPGDEVSIDTSGTIIGTFDNRDFGTGKTVVITGLTLAGAQADNYTLTDPTRTANITKLPVTVTAVVDSKTYDGTTVSNKLPILDSGTPLAAGDNEPVWTQTFDNKNAGTGKTLTPAGLVDDGNNGLNYSYDYATNTNGEISKLPITVTAVTNTKIYDGTTASNGLPTLSAGTPLAFGDGEPVWTQTFNNKNVGIDKTLTPAGVVIDNNSGNNYTYSFITDTTGVIENRPVTLMADAKSKIIGTPDPVLTYHVSSGSLAAGDTLTLKRAPGTTAGVYPISIFSFPAAGNYNVTYVGANLTITPILTFKSQGLNDGWVLESSRLSSVGGTKNSIDTTFILGDDAAKRQYRSIMSFDTSSLPNGAVIRSAVLKIKQSGTPVGINPFTILGPLLVDVQKGSFGTPALNIIDFQLKPSGAGVGMIPNKQVGGWYSASLNLTGRSKINTTGLTQFRLNFSKGDNNDTIANYIKFMSGNSPSGQPQLIIKYTLP
jgi:hypothetical protein